MTESSSASSPGIDPQTALSNQSGAQPFNAVSFAQMRVLETWRQYEGRLSWGRGQCLAILDDGCDITQPAWRAVMPWGPKVIATWNSVDGNADCAHVPPGYHGTTVGYPSSMNHDGVHGVAWQNQVAHVRCASVVHLRRDESASIARGLRWVIDHHEKYRITTVNLAVLDDQRHPQPLPAAIDLPLMKLADLGIWVSAPAGNHHYEDGISWPACQPWCFGIGATMPDQSVTRVGATQVAHRVHLDRFSNVDLLAPAVATSSSNAYAAGCSMILREAIERTGFNWRSQGCTLPQAMLAIFQKTGFPVHDDATGLAFKALDLLAAVRLVMGE